MIITVLVFCLFFPYLLSIQLINNIVGSTDNPQIWSIIRALVVVSQRQSESAEPYHGNRGDLLF